MAEHLLEVEHLKQYFPIRDGFFSTKPLKAVDDVSFTIDPGETLGLVGESGCGKTTVGRSILRLYEPTGGTVRFEGEEITARNIHSLRKKMQMVFQDPYSSLNPRMTVEDIIGEPLDVHKMYTSREDRRDQILNLMEMIGLERAKSVIKQALDYNKAQKIFADKGLIADRTSMHMVFTGNPGTAKTSVARLFAEIMKDNDVLSEGNLIECGRADLVGPFVGWTTPMVKKKFKEAKGSVLFIDEAYSLVDDRDGLFGDEAINTIVQEMENHRDDVVVIFAGYPDKMEGFLQKNPGLRSRIAYHVPFDDYNADELCDIADLIAKKRDLVLADDARVKLREVFTLALKDSDFGNGRYVRNVLEKAKMAQASRLVAMDYASVTSEDVKTIVASDIELPVQKAKQTRIGFVA